MLKKAHITTHLLTVTDNGEETFTSEEQGGCLIEDTGIMLRYPEPDNQGTATLVVGDGLVQLRRQGNTRSRLTFIEQQLVPADYTTAQGSLDMSLFTHQRHFSLHAGGGRLELRYTLLWAGTQVADNTLTIRWKFL